MFCPKKIQGFSFSFSFPFQVYIFFSSFPPQKKNKSQQTTKKTYQNPLSHELLL